jgi:hypothetical protein
VEQKWLEGSKVMGFCKRKGVDCECLTDHSTCNSDNCYKKLPDISKKKLEGDKVMTFKEKLIEQAERASEINIEKEMDIIKARMAENAEGREFTICLINPTKRGTMAIGGGTNHFQTFVPAGCKPYEYQRIFLDALQGLGFTVEDISLEVKSFKGYDSYNIKITW